jgi:protocatechuate 3,4-dioxygenase beta subunit
MIDPTHRRSFLKLVAAAAVAVVPAKLRAQTANQPRWVDPPGEETSEVAKLIAAAVKELNSGASPSAVLSNPRYASIHPFPSFRAAIKSHATSAPLTMVAKSEPGERAILKLALVTKDRTPLRDVLIYLYHTSAKGWYSDSAAHVRASSGDQRHARLFGYVRTNQQGRADIHTIRPGGYPDGDLPSHVHIEVAEPGTALVSEVVFSDDPRLTPEAKARSLQHGFVVSNPSKGADGVWQIDALFQQR